jgi:hypothetical protein
LELFGGIGTGLAAVLQAGIKVQRYVYVDTDEAARQVAKHHSRGLCVRFPELLTTTAILSSFSSLPGDISLISEKDLHWLGHVDLVIAGWPCQGMSMAGNQNGLQDGRSSRFYNMVHIIHYLQTSQRQASGYIVENVPVVSSSRSRTLETGLSRGRFRTDGRTDDRTMAAGASVTWTHCSVLFEVTWGKTAASARMGSVQAIDAKGLYKGSSNVPFSLPLSPWPREAMVCLVHFVVWAVIRGSFFWSYLSLFYRSSFSLLSLLKTISRSLLLRLQ